ncbi:hypothetical protein GW17_00015127, partial [Ensete ventricosum]
SGSASVASSNSRKVQNLIERCLQLYMNRGEVVRTLSSRARIEPGFTTLVLPQHPMPATFQPHVDPMGCGLSSCHVVNGIPAPGKDLGVLGDYDGSPFLPSDSDILLNSPEQDDIGNLKNTLPTLPQDHALTNQMKKNLKDEP